MTDKKSLAELHAERVRLDMQIERAALAQLSRHNMHMEGLIMALEELAAQHGFILGRSNRKREEVLTLKNRNNGRQLRIALSFVDATDSDTDIPSSPVTVYDHEARIAFTSDGACYPKALTGLVHGWLTAPPMED